MLPPPPTSSYFTPPNFGSFVQPPHDSSLGQLPPPPPPPPPPSSPPPGPPPLPPSSPPGPTVINVVTSGDIDNSLNCNDVNGSETSVKDTPDNIASDIPPPPPPPRPRDEKTVRKIEVLCQYIAKNGSKFEDMTCQKEVGNPEFEFLFGGVPGSEAAISHEYFKWMKKKCCSGELHEGRHDEDISLKPSVFGTPHEDIAHSPAGSDMDMEDDITRPEAPGIVKSFESERYGPSFTSNEDIKVEEHVCDLKKISHKDATDGKVYCSDASQVIEQGPNLSQDSMQFEKSKLKVGVADSEWSLDRKADQKNVNLHQEMNQSGTSAATKDSPFRLIQGYASDDSPESDNDPHLENISPEAVSPHVKENDIEAKNSSELDTGVGPLSLNIASKIPESSTKFEDLDNRIDKQICHLKGNDVADPKIVGARKKDCNAKLEVDEFGRMVKKGGSDSDSDDYYARRRGRRGRSRSRSRSRSPNRRRRRWRDKRSRSRSWSPKKRSRSRSPYRRNMIHREICHDFRRGKCFRGTTCRYIHESDKGEEFRHHKNKQHYYEVSDELKFSDKLVPEKNDVGSQELQELYQDVSRSSDRVNEEFLEAPGQSAEVASSHETLDVNKLVSGVPSHSASAENYPVYQAPSSSEHSRLSVQPTSLWNSLPPPPPPPPRPQLGGPLPLYQQNQLPFQTNYPFQAFVTPYGPEMATQTGMYPMSYPMLQRPGDPGIFGEKNFAQIPSPNIISSNSRDPPAGTVQSCSAENMRPSSEGHAYMSRYAMHNHVAVADSVSDFGRSRISSHYNPYASTFDQPLGSKFSSGVLNQDTATSYSNKYGPLVDQNRTPDEELMRSFAYNQPRSAGDQYDPLFDSIEPSSNSFKKIDHGNNKEVATAASEENDEFGETADAEVGAVENDSPSPSSPIDLRDVATGEIEIDQPKDSGKTTKSKDSRSMKLFKIALADFVKEVLKPSWRQGNMSKEAFKTIVKKTVDKVSGAMKKHQIPKSQAKINHYIDSSQRKLTKLVMGYVDKYVKV